MEKKFGSKSTYTSSSNNVNSKEQPLQTKSVSSTSYKLSSSKSVTQKTASADNLNKKQIESKNKHFKKSNLSPREKRLRSWKIFKRVTITYAACILLSASIILGLAVGRKFSITPYYPINYGTETFYDESNIQDYSYDTSIKATSLVGFSGRQIGTIERTISTQTRDEGLSTGYPTYGRNLSGVIGSDATKQKQRRALIAEANYLCATGTANAGSGGGYTRMDELGFLYNGDKPALDKNNEHRRLYKHTSAVGMYLGNVSDDEPRVIKEVTMRPRGYNGYSVTGIYAPAGEVIKIQLSERDMNATGGLTIHIGQALYNGQANNIWAEKNQMPRFPVILNTMVVNKSTAMLENGIYTAYVGSFLGGPLYIRNNDATFTATISGGVNYSHFILGYTTKEEFEQNKQSSAPYFDLEVWNYGVLLSGPKYYARNFSYEDIYKAAVLWEKVASVTTTGANQGVVFIYDPFVAAGAAVAFPGRRSVNCPAGWMTQALNYNTLVTSGSWGNFHEYHHNFQGYGVGDGGEVTNNAMTLVSYSLFTKISSARRLNSFGASGLSDWNRYTSATWALDQVLRDNPDNGRRGLTLYATLLHNFGPDKFIQSKYRQRNSGYGESYIGYLRAWQDVTHYDMSYYFNDILKAGISEETLSNYHNDSYPMFVPVSSVFQTGRSYNYNGEKKYIDTMQPYVIQFGKDFTIDLNRYTQVNGMYTSGSVILPQGFSYRVKSISQPEHGTITPTDQSGVYTFTPDKSSLRSGKIIATLEITKDDGAFAVEDVDLTLEFEQSHETNKAILERTVYTYTEDTAYTSAITAFENNYEGFISKKESDNINKNQNSNTDIWFTNQENDMCPENSVIELKGKIYVDETAKYRIALRGRWNIALYVSLDNGNNYELAASYISPDSNYVFPNTEGTYRDYQLEGNTWLHFKAVMISGMEEGGSRASFIGVGWGKFTPELAIIDENGEVVGYTPESISISYANAYRSSYEFVKSQFESDYFYTRKYNYNYLGTPVDVCAGKTQTLVTELSNYVPWDASLHDIQNLFDDEPNTGIHFARDWGVSTSKPAILTLDIGENVTANSMTLYTYQQTASENKGFPKNFTLEGSLDGENFFDMGRWTGTTQPSGSSSFTFLNERYFTFRYYRLTVTSTENGRVALNGLKFFNTLRLTGNGQNFLTPDDERFTYSGDWTGVQTYSSFGHIYVGKQNATMSFEFTGTRLGILSSKKYGKDFEVYIDGQKIDSVEVKEDASEYCVSYISTKLSSGKHNVKIKCVGESNIDSIIYYNEA